MMNRFRTFLIVLSVASTGAGSALAQNSASALAGASSTIFQPITLTKNTDLEFGTVVRPASGSGTVTINAVTGLRTLTGDGSLLSSGATPSRATFTINGEGGQAFNITTPGSMNMTRTGGSETIAVTLTPTGTGGTLSNTLGTPGSAAFSIGGEFQVTPSTTTGAYAGSFNVTVAYN